jgi:hypothetical protein
MVCIELTVLEQMVNLVAVDGNSTLEESRNVSANSYLTKIIIEPNNLFNYCNMGCKRYEFPKKKLI